MTLLMAIGVLLLWYILLYLEYRVPQTTRPSNKINKNKINYVQWVVYPDSVKLEPSLPPDSPLKALTPADIDYLQAWGWEAPEGIVTDEPARLRMILITGASMYMNLK